MDVFYFFRFRFFDNVFNLFLQIFFRYVCLKFTGQCLQNPNFFTPNFLWLSEVRCLQNKWNILSSWVLKYVSESTDTKITSGEQQVNGLNIPPNDCRTYNPIFSCRSFLELQAAFESFKCIPQRYLRPTSLSNWLTIERVWYLLSTVLKKIVLVKLKRRHWVTWRSMIKVNLLPTFFRLNIITL